MNTLRSSGWLVAAALGVLLWINGKLSQLDNQVVPSGVVPHGFTARDVKLAPDDAAKVVIRPGRLAVVRPDRTTTKFVPEGAAVAVTVKKDNRVDVKVQQFGFSLNPGLGLALGVGKPAGVLDLRFVYYNRLSGLVGITLQKAPSVYVGVGVNVVSRTSLWIGKTRDGYLGGVRVSW